MLNTIWLLKTYLLRFNKYVKTILHKQQELFTGCSYGFLHQAVYLVNRCTLYETIKNNNKESPRASIWEGKRDSESVCCLLPLETSNQFLCETVKKNELGGLPSSSFVLCAKPTGLFGMTDEHHLGALAGVGEGRSSGGVTWSKSWGEGLMGTWARFLMLTNPPYAQKLQNASMCVCPRRHSCSHTNLISYTQCIREEILTPEECLETLIVHFVYQLWCSLNSPCYLKANCAERKTVSPLTASSPPAEMAGIRRSLCSWPRVLTLRRCL